MGLKVLREAQIWLLLTVETINRHDYFKDRWKIENLTIIYVFTASAHVNRWIFGGFLNETCRIKWWNVTFTHGSILQTITLRSIRNLTIISVSHHLALISVVFSACFSLDPSVSAVLGCVLSADCRGNRRLSDGWSRCRMLREWNLLPQTHFVLMRMKMMRMIICSVSAAADLLIALTWDWNTEVTTRDIYRIYKVYVYSLRPENDWSFSTVAADKTRKL